MYLYCIYVRLGIIDCLRIKFRKETPSRNDTPARFALIPEAAKTQK